MQKISKADDVDTLSSNPSEYDNLFPQIDRPRLVGEFSLDGKTHRIQVGRSRVKYLHEDLLKNGGKCALNLNIGFERFISKPDEPSGSISGVLDWIRVHAGQQGAASLRKICHEADIVCMRGVLSRIACSPYETREDWRLAFVKYNGVIFGCEFITESRRLQQQLATARQNLMSYWGFKFEQCVTSESKTSKPKTNEPVNNLEEFDVVMKSKIGVPKTPIRLMYMAETDCVNADGDYIELKTQRMELNQSFWKFKARKWWIQSFLCDIRQIVVGFRNDDGIVNRVQSIKVSELAEKKTQNWSPGVMFNFLLAFLAKVKKHLDASEDLVYHLVEFNPGSQTVTFQTIPANNEMFKFLSDDFLSYFK